MFKKRIGISTFIATLLLMVLAVSAGVVIYAYTMGYMGGFGGTDTLGAISLDEAAGSVSTGVITAYVRNIGKTSIVFDSVYVDGVLYQLDSDGTLADGEFETNAAADTIAEGEVCLITIMENNLAAGTTYAVKVIGEDNTQLSFSVKCGP